VDVSAWSLSASADAALAAVGTNAFEISCAMWDLFSVACLLFVGFVFCLFEERVCSRLADTAQ
jgi:hypothetical protein